MGMNRLQRDNSSKSPVKHLEHGAHAPTAEGIDYFVPIVENGSARQPMAFRFMISMRHVHRRGCGMIDSSVRRIGESGIAFHAFGRAEGVDMAAAETGNS